MVLIPKFGTLLGSDITPSEITDENAFHQRRKFLQQLVATGLVSLTGKHVLAANVCEVDIPKVADKLTPYKSISRYNNYYEFTTNKKMVVHIAKELSLKPWTIQIEGEVEKPITIGMEDILKKVFSARTDLSFSLC